MKDTGKNERWNVGPKSICIIGSVQNITRIEKIAASLNLIQKYIIAVTVRDWMAGRLDGSCFQKQSLHSWIQVISTNVGTLNSSEANINHWGLLQQLAALLQTIIHRTLLPNNQLLCTLFTYSDRLIVELYFLFKLTRQAVIFPSLWTLSKLSVLCQNNASLTNSCSNRIDLAREFQALNFPPSSLLILKQ